LISFVQERTNLLANSQHLAAMHAMSAVAIQFDQLCVKQIGKRGRLPGIQHTLSVPYAM
jgi:hypothetical protein